MNPRSGKDRIIVKTNPYCAYVSIHCRIVEYAILFAGLVLGALVTATAQSSGMYHWVAWIGLLPLFAAVRRLTGIAAAASGALWGGTVYIAAVMIADTPLAFSWRICLISGAIPALYLFAVAWFIRRYGYSALALALGWVIVEFVAKATGAYPDLIGAEQSPSALFKLIADFLGTGFIALVIVYASAFVISFTWAIYFGGILFYEWLRRAPVLRFIAWIQSSFHSQCHHQPSQSRAPPCRYDLHLPFTCN